MNRLIVFNSVSLDGYFTGANGDMSWAHSRKPDTEWDEFVRGNAGGDSRLAIENAYGLLEERRLQLHVTIKDVDIFSVAVLIAELRTYATASLVSTFKPHD